MNQAEIEPKAPGNFKFTIPAEDRIQEVEVEAGSAVIFVGANGSGKTRLAVLLEQQLQANGHRISGLLPVSKTPC